MRHAGELKQRTADTQAALRKRDELEADLQRRLDEASSRLAQRQAEWDRDSARVREAARTAAASFASQSAAFESWWAGFRERREEARPAPKGETAQTQPAGAMAASAGIDAGEWTSLRQRLDGALRCAMALTNASSSGWEGSLRDRTRARAESKSRRSKRLARPPRKPRR